MKSIMKSFAAAAVVAGGLFGAASTADAQIVIQIPFPQIDPVKALNQSAACLAFGHLDRDGHKFEDPSHHKYDELLKKYAEALESYSGWGNTKQQLSNLRFSANGVCFYNHGTDKGPVVPDQKTGTFDVNIINGTPWGAQIKTPDEVAESLDSAVHYTIYTLNAQTLATQLVPPQLDMELAAFLQTLVNANAHAEAVLATMERGIKQGNLDELAAILYDNSPMLADEISELYVSATEKGAVTEQARKEFKAAAFKAFASSPQFRLGLFQSIGQQMQVMAQRGTDISKLFNQTPDRAQTDTILTARFGEELAKLQIDGQSLQDAYAAIWSDPATDPATQAKVQLKAFQAQIGTAHAQREAQQQEQQPAAPTAPAPAAPD